MNIVMKIKSGETDEFELLEYITSNDFDVALAATESPLASSKILKIAVKDKDERIRIAALRNKNISDELILMLCNDNNFSVASLARAEAERRHL